MPTNKAIKIEAIDKWCCCKYFLSHNICDASLRETLLRKWILRTFFHFERWKGICFIPSIVLYQRSWSRWNWFILANTVITKEEAVEKQQINIQMKERGERRCPRLMQARRVFKTSYPWMSSILFLLLFQQQIRCRWDSLIMKISLSFSKVRIIPQKDNVPSIE